MDWDGDLQKALVFIKEHALCDDIVKMYLMGPPDDKGFMWWQNDSHEYKTMKSFVLDMDYDSSAYGCMQRRIQSAIRDMHGNQSVGKTVPEKEIIRMIKAITNQCLQIGHLPRNVIELMRLFKDVPATREEIYQLATDNKLEWVIGSTETPSPDKYKSSMNESLAYYLRPTCEQVYEARKSWPTCEPPPLAQTVTDYNKLGENVDLEPPYRQMKNDAFFDKDLNRWVFPTARSHMDETNRDAADVMDREGTDEGIKHMYEQAGGDYAKMRSMFG